jgi:Family of unknown function (DUF6527)
MSERLGRFTQILDWNEMPQTMRHRDEAIFVWGGQYPKWLVFECPCGCANMTHINLMKSHEPHWDWSKNEADHKITLSPSILNRTCGAHYFIRDNDIVWC